MDAKELAVLLQQVRAGRLSVEEAITRLKSELGLRSGSGSGSAGDSGNAPDDERGGRAEEGDARASEDGVKADDPAGGRVADVLPTAAFADAPSVADLGFAQVDLDRQRRTGAPEVVFGEGKTAEQIAAIIRSLQQNADRVLATRVDAAKAESVSALVPGLIYHADARALTWFRTPPSETAPRGTVAVVSAGTSDLPVAEEAAVTAEWMGARVLRVRDVGVAGIHRLFRRLDTIRAADAVVVVAGMEGALASVVGGLVAAPVVAVPTSVGYGAHFQGLAPLLTMLNSCAPGVVVVNIDNGFGAGYAAGMIAVRTAAVRNPRPTGRRPDEHHADERPSV